MIEKPIQIGDHAPWFDAQTLANTRHNLGVMAGRWVALYFLKSLSDPHGTRVLADIITSLGRFFNDDHVVLFVVLAEPPPQGLEQFVQASHRGLGFIMDYENNIGRLYGISGESRLMVLDPMLRLENFFPVRDEKASSEEICNYLKKLPLIDDFAGVPLTAPALIIPHVFEPEFCEFLVNLYNVNGGKDSGFMVDKDGKTMTVINHDLKQRSDFIITDPSVMQDIRNRIISRVIPAMERFFQYKPTRMDRYLVSCYDSESGGHFSRHRDNVNAGAKHRRFAASFNLNRDYEGCDLIFPEFGRRLYKAPPGGVIIFSTGALHQVTPITKGKRYAFVPFFYGEEEAKLREANNALLHNTESAYTGEIDRLFPA